MNQVKVAVVTGSNKGIGFYIVKRLCQEFDGHVYLTARNVDNGKRAIQSLNDMGLNPKFHQLDIESMESIQNFAEYLKNTYGGIDVLVNNAGVFPKVNDEMTVERVAKETMNINYFGTINVSNALFPLLRSNARVVNVSSKLGLLTRVVSEELRKKIADPSNSIEQISQIANDYINACTNGTYKSLGYPNTAYDMSKVALCAATMIQQKLIDMDKSRENIKISSATPGYCKTDMTGQNGEFTAEEGADTPVFLTQVDNSVVGGQFWSDRKVCDWHNEIFIW